VVSAPSNLARLSEVLAVDDRVLIVLTPKCPVRKSHHHFDSIRGELQG
jgi:hypothetical protein